MAQVKILAFETSSYACSVALLNEEQIELRHEVAPMQQTQLILSMIQDVLQKAELQLTDLNAIAYGCGPGSFTGIRIANTVAQGLAFAVNLPVIQISSLAALAQTVYLEQKHTHLLTAVDARMNEVYWAQYQVNECGLAKLVGKESVGLPSAVNTKISVDTKWFAVGDAWKKYADVLIKAIGTEPEIVDVSFATAEAVLQLAKDKFARGECVKAAAAAPIYLR